MPVLLSAAILAMVLGSIHAFSVLLIPLEARFDAPRALVSATYSFALAALTLAVFLGHRVFETWPAARLVLAIGLTAAFGAGVAAMAPSLPFVWLGYSLLFGGANGLGYGFGLQIASRANPGREGMSMGIVTAAYALGSVIAPVLFAYALSHGGFQAAMLGLMTVLILASVACALLLRTASLAHAQKSDDMPKLKMRFGRLGVLWLGYGTGVAAGLMVIGHAAGIAASQSLDLAAWAAPVVIALSNLTGSLIAGRLVDRLSPLWPLVVLPLISVASVTVLAGVTSLGFLMLCLAGVGFSYGGLIAAYPAAITKIYGAMDSSRIYGKVFTAWGCAGLVAPWLAGRLFDQTGAYQTALWVAGALGLVSACAILAFSRLGGGGGPLLRNGRKV